MSVIISISLNNYNTKINPSYCRDLPSEDSQESEEDENYEKQCRICLEEEGELITVCGCRGSIKYVHKDCIMNWQKVAPSEELKMICQLCKQPYNYEGQLELEREQSIGYTNNVNVFIVLLASIFIGLVLILILMGLN